jgi:hypothetical protein
MSDPVARSDINIRSARYFIARTEAICWHCRASTEMFAVGLPPGHEALVLDENAQDDGAEDTWSLETHGAFLFYIEHLPRGALDRLSQLTQCYRFGHSDEAAGSYWANHCQACGSLLDDHELFCEPEGAFLPSCEAAAKIIRLTPIDEGFEAVAAGYAYEVRFFDAMSRG